MSKITNARFSYNIPTISNFNSINEFSFKAIINSLGTSPGVSDFLNTFKPFSTNECSFRTVELFFYLTSAIKHFYPSNNRREEIHELYTKYLMLFGDSVYNAHFFKQNKAVLDNFFNSKSEAVDMVNEVYKLYIEKSIYKHCVLIVETFAHNEEQIKEARRTYDSVLDRVKRS